MDWLLALELLHLPLYGLSLPEQIYVLSVVGHTRHHCFHRLPFMHHT